MDSSSSLDYRIAHSAILLLIEDIIEVNLHIAGRAIAGLPPERGGKAARRSWL